MIRSLILGVLAMVLLVSGPTPAYSCGAKVEIRFFDSDGDIFAIHNKSEGPLKLVSLVISATLSGAAGAMYALLFSYIGSTFASIQYSIFPLLWTLVGGMGTLIGPVLGTGLMFYLVDISSGLTESHLIVVGVVLVGLVLWFPKGVMGTIREKWLTWLP